MQIESQKSIKFKCSTATELTLEIIKMSIKGSYLSILSYTEAADQLFPKYLFFFSRNNIFKEISRTHQIFQESFFKII